MIEFAIRMLDTDTARARYVKFDLSKEAYESMTPEQFAERMLVPAAHALKSTPLSTPGDAAAVMP